MPNPSRSFGRRGVCILVCLIGVVPSAPADEIAFDARELFDASTTRDVSLAEDGRSLRLARGELVSDDGPSAGYSYKPNEETLGPGVRVRKRLVIDDPRTLGAQLLIGSTATFRAEINGAAVNLPAPSKLGNYWLGFAIPADRLRAGSNDVVLSGTGKLWIARADEYAAGADTDSGPPNRSAKSRDDGATWSENTLGTKNDVEGEYCVRLFLDRHRPSGVVTLPTLDLANLKGTELAPVVENDDAIGMVVVRTAAKTAADTSVSVRVRTGPTPVPEPSRWSDWRAPAADGAVAERKGRYAQVEITLTTRDPRTTPELERVSLRTDFAPRADWTARWKAKDVRNADIVRTSIPFRYEPFDHPRLRLLREKHQLDDVVKGAATEWEQIERLAAWAARQWESGHLGKIYPGWDALDILAPHDDGTPVGGFCQQYNLVFLQACESLGIPGRCVSIGSGDHGVGIRSGHETVEVWSNDFSKWVYVDGNAAWYFRDEASGVPLSLRELRERQLAAIAGRPHAAVKCVTLAKTRYEWRDLTGWPAFAELRLISRSDFLDRKRPLPLNQGMRGWFWTGHHAWTDAAYPASLLYGHRVEQPRNWDWTLNQTKFRLEPTPREGEVRVHLETVTPGFDRFAARIDGGEWKDVSSGFDWTLHAGTNRVEVRSRNILGRAGPVSRVDVVDAQ